MNSLIREIRPALVATGLLTILLCLIYPVVVWTIAQTVFPNQANGSLIRDERGIVVGSVLIGQPFSSDKYFLPRPSSAGAGYDAASSGGSNLGPLSQKLSDQIAARVLEYRKLNSLTDSVDVPADAVTSSASGLDPHISLANALLQAPRVAQARNISTERVHKYIEDAIEGRALGILGEPGVNVLIVNIALDKER